MMQVSLRSMECIDSSTFSFYAPLSNFPSDDEVADTALINRTIEVAVREKPEQYLWVHRRFKHSLMDRKGFIDAPEQPH